MTQYSYSRVDLYDRCPYHFKLKYLDKLTELPNYTADNPLILGTAMHDGIEKGVDFAVDKYLSSYPIITDEIINQTITLSILIPKVHEWLKQFKGAKITHEYEINTPDYRGYVDLIIEDGDETLVVDFKYSNAIEAYSKSNQLHVYKHYLDQQGFNVTRLGYLFIEKKSIKWKKNESVYHLRKRIEAISHEAKLTFLPIEYDERKSLDFDWAIHAIEHDDTWTKNPTGSCFACNAIEAKASGKWTPLAPPEYLEAIQNENGEILMVLPKNERRDVTKITKKILWLYGAPFSGKTWFANAFPDVLMLNTDGNVKFVDAPFINIADEVKKTGRITQTRLAWDKLDDALSELETSEHGFKTVVFDLLEDLYTAARFKVYEEEDISHESDNSFKAWDLVTTKFLQAVKRIINLNVENIIFISHEDISKDITKRTGDKITSIQPNLREKVALKVAGMVDIVGRVVTDGDDRKLVFKSQSYVFSGGRIPNMPVDEIELTYEAFINVYEVANEGLKIKSVRTKAVEKPVDTADISDVEAIEPVAEVVTEEEPKRGRRKNVEVVEENVEVETVDEPDTTVPEDEETEEAIPDTNVPEEPTKPARARRRRKSADVDETPSREEDDNETSEVNEEFESGETNTETEVAARPRRRRRTRA